MVKRIIFISCFICIQWALSAQSADKKFKQFPYWIDMMNSPTCNYFEAIKAFTLFWEGREKPIEEKERMQAAENGEKSYKEDKQLMRRMKRLTPESINLTFQYKKFMHWAEMIKPYVLEDGSILTEEQIQQIK